MDYYNYTLLNVIESNKQLELQEIWFTLNALADLGQLMHSNEIKVNPFRIESVFVSLKGMPCVYIADNSLTDDEESVVSLGFTILSLVAMKKVGAAEVTEALVAVRRKSAELGDILERMTKNEVTFSKIVDEIEKLAN